MPGHYGVEAVLLEGNKKIPHTPVLDKFQVTDGGSGPEEAFAREQLQEFHRLHPNIRVAYQATPSSANDRHTLYVTWLSSHSADIDVLNLDVIWVPEFAAAGWLLALDAATSAAGLSLEDFLPAGLACSRYQGKLFALPWFADAGLLYYRKDLYAAAGVAPPETFADLLQVGGSSRWPRPGKFMTTRPTGLWQGSSALRP